VTIYKGLKICRAIPCQCIVISGAGRGAGALEIQYPKAMEHQTIAIDKGKGKEEYCLGLGDEVYINLATAADVASVVARSLWMRRCGTLVPAGSGRAYRSTKDALGQVSNFIGS
jgi:propanol-preferring alcohol dehydrogenase